MQCWLVLVLASFALCADILPTSIFIKTKLGQWNGIENDDSILFEGIPFAQPPIGENRWRKPIPNDEIFNKDYVGNFTQPGPACPQVQSAISQVFPAGYSEDCLTLNMEIPKAAFDSTTNSFRKEQKLAVMVFFHGGGFTVGMGKDYYVRSEEYIKREVILITINYRLGILGFLSLKELRDDDPQSYNFGLLDQRIALRWISNNIELFGGDRNRITLFGESAGAMSILWQLSMNEDDLPEDQSLEHIYSAIIQSPADVPIITCSEADVIFESALKKNVPCAGRPLLDCLRELDSDTLLTVLPIFPDVRKMFFHTLTPGSGSLMPCIGDTIFTKSYRDAFASGEFNANPNFIIGTTNDEGLLFTFLTFMIFENNDENVFREMMKGAFPDNDDDDDAMALINEYSSLEGWSATEMLAEVINDAYFQLGVHRLANAISEKQNNTYRYVFNHISQNGPPKHLKAFHASELAYIFHLSVGGLSPEQFTEEEEKLSHDMIDYWVNLAKAGSPVPPGSNLTLWPQYSEDVPKVQQLSVPIVTLDSYRQNRMNLWTRIYPHGVPWMGEYNEMIFEKRISKILNVLFFYCIANLVTTVLVIVSTLVLFVLSCWYLCCKRSPSKMKHE